MTVTAKDAYATMSAWVNRGATRDDDFIAEFLADHSTLQSQVISYWLKVMYAWVDRVEDDLAWRVDPRNEAAYRKAKAIVDLLGPNGYMVPFI